MGVGRISLRLLAKAFLILPLVLPSGAPGAQKATQIPDKDAKKQESPKETKKVAPRVWTNDDFPSGHVVQPANPEDKETKPEAKEEAKEIKPKPDDVSHADPLLERFLKMTPEARRKTIGIDEEDVKGAQDRMDELKSESVGETDPAKLQQMKEEFARMKGIYIEYSHELDVLHTIPPRQPAKMDSEKKTDTAPTEPPAPETKTESTPPPDQP